MGFYARIEDATRACQSQWLEQLSRSSDLNQVLPILYPEPKSMVDYQSRLIAFIEQEGPSGLGVLQYLNLRLEPAITDYVEGGSNDFENLMTITSVLDDNAFHVVSEGFPAEPIISVSTNPQFNEYVKNITMCAADLLLLDEPAIHHFRRSLEGALAILRKYCPQALNALSGRHVKIIPVVSPERNLSLSASNEFVSATITASWVTPKECAEMLLHEMGHSLLADIIFSAKLWSADASDLYYSPFRGDARPVEGVLHAAYSFHNVCIYKSTLIINAKGRLSTWARRTFESDFLRTLVCVRILSESGVLTESGYALVRTIDQDLGEIAVHLDLNRDAKAISSLRRHFADWLANNQSVPPSSRDLSARVVDEVIEEYANAEKSNRPNPQLENKKTTKKDSSDIFRVFDSTAEFWRLGFPAEVSVLRGKSPKIRDSIAADIAKNGDLMIPVIEKDSYKGNASDPRCMMTVGEALERNSGKYILVLRNYERISSCVTEMEAFISGQDFAIGATEHLLFHNCADITVPLHTDSSNNLHFVVSGKKTFFIADADEDFSDPGDATYQDGFSSFRPFDDPDVALAFGQFVTLHAGDVLFIPPERWHAVHYHETSISLSIFDEIDSSFAVTRRL